VALIDHIVRVSVRNALAAAVEHQFHSVAFPLIGAGTGGLDREVVRDVMLDEISRCSFSGRVIVVSLPGAG
jgi:O-acetyl-ADP-ribose deacetylase (regulator of RNase III)